MLDAAPPVAEDLPPVVSGLFFCRRRSSGSWPNNMAESDTLPSSPAAIPAAAAAAAVVPPGAVVVGGTSAEGWYALEAGPPRAWCRRPPV